MLCTDKEFVGLFDLKRLLFDFITSSWEDVKVIWVMIALCYTISVYYSNITFLHKLLGKKWNQLEWKEMWLLMTRAVQIILLAATS